MMSAELGLQPALVPVLLNMLELALLGNYPGSLSPIKWESRCTTQRSQHWDRFDLESWCAACHKDVRATCPRCGDVAKKDDEQHKQHLCSLCLYLHRYKFWVFYAVKIYYVYTVRQAGFINGMLERESGWVAHTQLTQRAVDAARDIIDRSFDTVQDQTAVRDAIGRASKLLFLFHDCTKPTIRRRYKSLELCRPMLMMCSRDHEKRVVGQWSGTQAPCDFLVAPAKRDRGDADAFPVDRSAHVAFFYACDERLAHLDNKRWCDVFTLDDVDKCARFCSMQFSDVCLEMLLQLGMSRSAHARLVKLCYESESRDMPDNKFSKLLPELRKPHAVDFYLLFYFLERVDHWNSVQTWPLDMKQTQAQIIALHLRHHTPFFDRLPPGVDYAYVCRSERKFYNSVVRPPEMSDRAAAANGDGSAIAIGKAHPMYATGVMGAFYDNEKHAIVCPRDVVSSNARKLRKSDEQRAMWCDDLQRATSIRTSLEVKRQCGSHSLEAISMIGRGVRVGNHSYVMCCKCASICMYQDCGVSPHGITCGREIRFFEADRFMALQTHVSPVVQHRRGHVPGDVMPLREVLLVAPPATGDRADLFTRTSTPVIDQKLTTSRLPFIDAAMTMGDSAARKSLLAASDNPAEGDLAHLLDEPDADEVEYGPGAITKSRAARPRTVRTVRTVKPRGKQAAVAATAETIDPNRDELDAALRGETRPMKPLDKQRRSLARFAERHRVRPDDFDEAEWAALPDDVKLFAWMDAGRTYYHCRTLLATSVLPNRDELLAQALRVETERCDALRAQNYYRRELDRMERADECEESERRRARCLHMESFSNSSIERMRQFCVGMGLIELQHDIVCAYCKLSCDPKGRYTRMVVSNIDAVLRHPLTGEQIEERGLVQIFMCPNCWKNAEPLLRANPAPMVSELFDAVDARRKKAKDLHAKNTAKK